MATRMETGDALSPREGIIAHGCNSLGAMGAGFAKFVKMRYPAAFVAYKRQQREEGLTLGSVSFAQVGPKLWIANVITQDRIYGPKGECLADLDAIEEGMRKVAAKARELGLSVEMPMIGTGLAHGDWSKIEPRIQAGLAEVEARVWVQAPKPSPSRFSPRR
jgi:O-acetyl-ADP-ribose deacetylase (regulator of RNase III)